MPVKKKSARNVARKAGKLACHKRVLATTQRDLFDRVVGILEHARSGVVRSVNSHMVLAYWLIGREIVQEIQGGADRAKYGETVIRDLSSRLNLHFGRGFSTSNLKYFRQFYQTYSHRLPSIGHELGGQFENASVRHETGDELAAITTANKPRGKSGDVRMGHEPRGVLEDLASAVKPEESLRGFSPHLSWTHYRTLLRVENPNERRFYEIEAEKDNWSVPHLERQIHTCLFARLLKSRDKAGVMDLATQGQEVLRPVDSIKHPYVLDFLDLPDGRTLHESSLESAIMDKLQPFLLELGKGFAFVARQLRIETETSHFYIDLVFYNYLLKCFVLIDLKMGKLTHQDIVQMDMYIRMFDELRRGPEDNPTVGIILCAERDEVVVKYSVLKSSKQIFASKYILVLPTEEEFRREIERERRLVEESATS